MSSDTKLENSVCRIILRYVIVIFTTTLCACTEPPKQKNIELATQFSPGTTVDFTFRSNNLILSGVFDTPAEPVSKALIIFVHGYGSTDIRARNSYADLRRRFNQVGIATAMWDKPGQGLSEGTFDINQAVSSSADEVLDAAKFLRQINAPGSKNIGIWGISRAGWIAPIALSQDKEINFWISISGTTAEDNFAYLLLSNLPYEGGTFEQAEQFADEWRRGCAVLRTKGSFTAFLDATPNLRNNQYIKKMRGKWPTRTQYISTQLSCNANACPNTDNDMCAYVFIDDFDVMLSSLNVNTLAIFGEKDLNVNWRKTLTLYQSTIGKNPQASLKTVSFKDADHNLHISETGSIKEMKAMTAAHKTDGYYDVQINWLLDNVLNDKTPENVLGSKK